MLKRRLFTATIGIPLMVCAFWLGGLFYTVLFCAVGAAALVEFYRMLCLGRQLSFLTCVGVACGLALLLRYHYSDSLLPAVVTGCLLVTLLLLLWVPPNQRPFLTWAWLVAGVWYIGWTLGYWLELRGLPSGLGWALLAAFAVFACDTGAYFVGRAWGTHPLAPAVSPAKTWEGAVGGFVSALLIGLLACAVWDLQDAGILCWQVLVGGCIVGLLAQLGDLAESMLKRSIGVKESGTLLPGHGGVLDRFDGFIFVGPAMYYYALWVTG